MNSGDPIAQGILEHVARYRLTTRRALYASLPQADRQAVDRQTRSLVASGRLNKITTLPVSKEAVYSLTPLATAELGLPSSRGRPSQAFAEHLMVLSYCLFGRKRRHRLETDEVATVFGELALQPPSELLAGRVFCIEEDSSKTTQSLRLTCLYLPGDRMEPKEVARYASELVTHFVVCPQFAVAMESAEFGIAVLVENPMRRDRLREAIAHRTTSKELGFRPVIYVECPEKEG